MAILSRTISTPLGADCCTLYGSTQFKGNYYYFCLGLKQSMKWDVNHYWDNQMSSWACGKNVAYLFCDSLGSDLEDCLNGNGVGGAGQIQNKNSGH